MSDGAPWSEIIRVADLAADEDREVLLVPDAATRAAIAAELGLRTLRKLRLEGRISPLGRADWQLTATLGATVVQDCVVTLAPVVTRIEEPVTRNYLAAMPELAEGDEIEMPDDDSSEPLTAELDIGAVMLEALALALPAYPHAEGVEPFDRNFAAPGTTPMSEQDVKPFAALSALKDKLKDESK